METIEYKKLAVAFIENIGDLVSDVMDVDEGEISDKEQEEIILKKAKDMLEEYDSLMSTLEPHFAKDFKVDPGESMERIRKLLIKIAEQ